LGKAATADSEESGLGNLIANGNDGDPSTRWCAADGNSGHWWSVDLGQAYGLTGFEVIWQANAIYGYGIEVSSNGTDWTLAVDRTTNGTAAQVTSDQVSVTARYVRITVTGLESYWWACFYEFEVFASA
jgi:hypothetical protein